MAANTEMEMEMDDDMDEDSIHETETETTIGSIDREEQQDEIERCTTIMLRKLMADPYASVPEIMEMIIQMGPYASKQTVFQIFGGREILRRTLRRMRIVRYAALRKELADLPLGVRLKIGEEVMNVTPGIDRYALSWAPWRTVEERHHESGLQRETGEYVFQENPQLEQEQQEIDRYPHPGEDAEGYLEDTEDTESDMAMDWE